MTPTLRGAIDQLIASGYDDTGLSIRVDQDQLFALTDVALIAEQQVRDQQQAATQLLRDLVQAGIQEDGRLTPAVAERLLQVRQAAVEYLKELDAPAVVVAPLVVIGGTVPVGSLPHSGGIDKFCVNHDGYTGWTNDCPACKIAAGTK